MQLLVCYTTEGFFFFLILLPTAMSIANGQVFHPFMGELNDK